MWEVEGGHLAKMKVQKALNLWITNKFTSTHLHHYDMNLTELTEKYFLGSRYILVLSSSSAPFSLSFSSLFLLLFLLHHFIYHYASHTPLSRSPA